MVVLVFIVMKRALRFQYENRSCHTQERMLASDCAPDAMRANRNVTSIPTTHENIAPCAEPII